MPMIDWIFDVNNIWLCWVCYCLLCMPLVYLMLKILPYRFNSTHYYNVFFLYILCVSIFVFGVFIALISVLILYFLKPVEEVNYSVQTTGYPDYQRSVITNKRNSLVLCDDIDELRLLSKNIIEKQEKVVIKQLKIITLKMNETTDSQLIAFYKKLKAQILWEQIYPYLVNNENLVSAVLKIKMLAKEAIDVLKKDTELPILLAKVALREHTIDEAKYWLEIAKKNHVPEYKMAAYFAEIDFLEKKYATIKNKFRNSNNKGISGLQPIISFWALHD